jgi:hypothetical protein
MKYISFLAITGSLFLAACKKDAPIGPPIEIKPDYVLPQGNAPKEANDRILQLFNNYGSYFLYNFTQKDFEWTQSAGTSNSKIDTAILGDPAYTGDMLALLNDIWLKFLPEDFKKKGGIPYRVFMTDSIRQYRFGFPPGREYLYFDYKVVGKSVTFAGMNASLRTLTPEQKVARKNLVIGVMWGYYQNNGVIDVPAAFYNVSDYAAPKPAFPVNAANPANLEAYRQKGFLPSSYNTFNDSPFEWLSFGDYSWTTAKSNDISSFLMHITQRTDAQMEPYLANYPLIKQKFNILVKHFKDKYNIDVRAIANATY